MHRETWKPVPMPPESPSSSLLSSLFFVCLFACLLACFVFQDSFSVCTLGCLRTQFVKQAALAFRDPHAHASGAVGLKACATVTQSGVLSNEPVMLTYSEGFP